MKLFKRKNKTIELVLLKQKRERYIKLDDLLVEGGFVHHTSQKQMHRFYLDEITKMEERIVEISPKMTKV
jgi:hypothetical protein